MRLVVRFVGTRGAWNGDQRSLERAAKDFHRRPQDTEGLSVFVVENDAHRALVMAAHACDARDGQGRKEALDFIEVDYAFVERFGPIAPDKCDSVVPAVNALHYALLWTPEQLGALAKSLFDERVEAKRWSIQQVCAAIAALDAERDVKPSARAFVMAVKIAAPSGG